MSTYTNLSLPPPFPYQGSKRNIARYILPYFPPDVDRLIEPFCGSSAVSIAACAYGLVDRVILNDINKPLMDLWAEILETPNELVDNYEKLWLEQQTDRKEHFVRIRKLFNKTHQPHYLLYLLARIVKGSVRYTADGMFNQSADNRRAGMHPVTMRKNIIKVSRLLEDKTTIQSTDFREVTSQVKELDLIYMDPPYQGTSFTRDHRYYNGLPYSAFIEALSDMNDRCVSYIISYDGFTGKKTHGKPLPEFLSLLRLHIHAGRSSQSTLLGRNDETVESLYLSPALVQRLKTKSPQIIHSTGRQQELTF